MKTSTQMLHEEEELLAHEKDSISQQIARGLDQLDRGEGMQERKITWQAEQ